MHVPPTLGFMFTFAGLFLLSVVLLFYHWVRLGGKSPNIISEPLSLSLSFSFICPRKFQLCILLSIIPEWESPWNQRRMCNMSKWAIHPWWSLESVTREEMYPRGSCKIPTLGIVFYLKTLRHFISLFIYPKKYLSGAIISSTVLTSARH